MMTWLPSIVTVLAVVALGVLKSMDELHEKNKSGVQGKKKSVKVVYICIYIFMFCTCV